MFHSKRTFLFLLLTSSLAFGQATKIREGSQTTGALPTVQGGLPAGGTTGQALTKINATDYNTQWSTIGLTYTPPLQLAGSVVSLDVGTNFLFTTQQRITTDNATTNFVDPVLVLAHNTTGTPANNIGSGLLFKLETDTTTNTDAGQLGVAWSDITHASRTAYFDFQLVGSGASMASKARLYASGGLSVGSSVDPGAGIINANSGFQKLGSEFPIAANGIVKRTAANTYSAATADTDYASNVFKNIAVSGQSTVVADSAADTVTLVNGSNVTITTDSSTDSITIAASVPGGGAPSDATYITQTAHGSLSAEQALSALATGLMKVTTTTGAVTSITDSAGLLGVISDETGSGSLVFGTAPQLSSIELGHATDTTLTRPSAGKVAIEGNEIITSATKLGYTLQGGSTANLVPVDATTYYFGAGAGNAIAVKTTYANASIVIPKAGTITRCTWKIFIVTNGTTESVQHYLRLNDTTDTTLSTTETYNPGANTQKTFTYTGLSIAVAAGDTIAFKMVCPTWATNPTFSSSDLLLYIE